MTFPSLISNPKDSDTFSAVTVQLYYFSAGIKSKDFYRGLCAVKKQLTHVHSGIYFKPDTCLDS